MSKRRFASASLLLASLALIGAGCGQSVSVSVNTPPAQHPAPAPAPVADACGNPYYPLKAGVAITYAITSSANASANSEYTLRVVSVSGTTAMIRTEMSSGVSADLEADCANGSVTMKGSFDLGAAAQGIKVKTTVVSSSGTFMPSNVAVGSTWDNSQTVKLESTGGATAGMGPITSTTESRSKAVAQESVTVPAGTYDALKVEVTRTTTTEFSGMPTGIKLPAGMKIPTPPPTVTTSTEWWVKGIGMVKTVTVSHGTTTTVVAKSVTGV